MFTNNDAEREFIMSSEVHYFKATTVLINAVSTILEVLGLKITERGLVYHRGAFYADVAKAIRLLLEMRISPFIESEYNWLWWAEECEKRAAALGSDAQFAMHLPLPRDSADWRAYPMIINLINRMVSLMFGVTKGEEEDADISDMGKLTAAECVKITHRFAHYWLGKRGGNQIGYVVPWPWLEHVAGELQYVYRSMGEPDRAGSAGTPGGPIPPISWPGA